MAPKLISLPILLSLPLSTWAQQPGSPETRPLLSTQRCTTANGCVDQDTSVVLDAASHNIHAVDSPNTSCTPGGSLDASLCPDAETCAQNCVIEGLGVSEYTAHGVSTNGAELTLTMYRDENGELVSLSPRVYLVSESGGAEYSALQLLNQEFTFDVDVSALPCGMNGALYLSEMESDGGQSDLNPAGAAYGTGYCDAQCYVTPWINGEANVEGNGACCHEMDIWEGNSRATGFTPHACLYEGGGLYECTSEDECDPASENDGICDKWGCGFNPYALGNEEYYGRDGEFRVDSTEPFTVVTQFHTDDNSTSGALSEIRRLYIQGGRVIQNAAVTVGGQQMDSLTDSLCDTTSSWFSGYGGMERMGNSLGRGMVLAMSIWNDAGGYMQWLDGGDAGPCNATEGAPEFIEENSPDTKVVFSNMKWGDIGSTFGSA